MNDVQVTRIKLLSLLACSTGILFIRDIRSSLLVSACIVGLSLLSRAKIAMKQRIVPVLTVCLFIMFFQLVFNTGIAPDLRILSGLVSGARLLSLSLLVFLFTQTTSVFQIVGALSFMPSSMRLMITISFALIPAIMVEISAIRRAQQSRGLQSHSILPILIPLLSRTLARAEHIGIVMQTRGYNNPV